MEKNIPIQNIFCSDADFTEFCSLYAQTIEAPTNPLLHQTSRFWFFTEGKGTLTLADQRYDIRPGTLVSVLPWQISQIIEVEDSLQYYLLAYYFDNVNNVIKNLYNVNGQPINLITEMKKSPVIYCNDLQTETLARLFENLQSEISLESAKDTPMIKSLHNISLINKIIEIIICYLQFTLNPSPSYQSVLEQDIKRTDIFHYMYNHLSQKLSLEQLSKIFFMSESSISAYITKVTGLSFFDLLNEMRIGKTINYLLYTDLTMEELAELLGFVDSSHICKVFSAKLGMRANEFRKTYQKVSDICKIDTHRTSYEIVNYIFRHYNEELTPMKVAEQFHISVKDLNTILLYQVEKNFSDFLNYIRVNQASKLLKNTDKCIIDIAVEVGYNNTKTLSRNFLQFLNMTPSAFRKEVELQNISV